LKVELLDQPLLAAAQAIAGRHVDHVPDRFAAGDLRLDDRPGVRNAVLVDGDAELLGGGIEDRDGLRLLVGAALRHEGDLLGGPGRKTRQREKPERNAEHRASEP